MPCMRNKQTKCKKIPYVFNTGCEVWARISLIQFYRGNLQSKVSHTKYFFCTLLLWQECLRVQLLSTSFQYSCDLFKKSEMVAVWSAFQTVITTKSNSEHFFFLTFEESTHNSQPTSCLTEQLKKRLGRFSLKFEKCHVQPRTKFAGLK